MVRLATYSIQLLNWISQRLGSYSMYPSSILTARVNCKLFRGDFSESSKNQYLIVGWCTCLHYPRMCMCVLRLLL